MALEARLTQDGYRVVAEEEAAGIEVRVRLWNDVASLEVSGPYARQRILYVADPNLLTIELAHWAVAVLDEVHAIRTRDARFEEMRRWSTPPSPRMPTATPVAAEVLAPARRSASGAVYAQGGVLWRSSSFDGVAAVGLRLGARRGIGGALETDVAAAEHLIRREVSPRGVLDARFVFKRGVVLGGGAFVGAVFTRSDRSTELPTRFVYATFGARAEMGYLAAPGIFAFARVSVAHRPAAPISANVGSSPLVFGLDMGVGWDFPLSTGTKRRRRA